MEDVQRPKAIGEAVEESVEESVEKPKEMVWKKNCWVEKE